MSTRYVRDEELIADAIRSTRRGVRDVQRPTGTERARTMETAEQAGADATFAKELAEELGLNMGELSDGVIAAAAQAAAAQSTADAAQVEAETARSEATSKAAAAQAAAEAYALAEAEAARLAAIAAASGDATDKAAAAEAAAVLAAAADATAKADAAEAAAKVVASAAQSTANTALSEAAAAQTAAGSATTIANQAQATASGKSKIFRSTSAPSGTGTADGDKWEQYDSLGAGGKLSGTWAWFDGSWRSTVLSETYLPLVNIGSGTYGTLAGARLAATAIDGMVITGATLRTAATGQRMQFDVNGLLAYDAANNLTAILSSSGQGMTVKDEVNNSVALMPRFGVRGTVQGDPDRNGNWSVDTNGLAIFKGAPEQVLQLEFLGPSLSPTSCRIFASVPFAIQAPGDMSIATVGTAVGKRITIEHEFAKLYKVEMSSSEVLLNSILRGRLSFGAQATAQGGYIEGIGYSGYKGGLLIQGGSYGVTTENGIDIKAGAGGDVTVEAASARKIRMLSPVENYGDTDWVYPTLSGGTNVAGNPFGYRRLNGVVWLTGRVNAGNGVTVFTMPPTFRIDGGADNVRLLDRGGWCRVNFKGAGAIEVISGEGGGGVSFAGTSYLPAP